MVNAAKTQLFDLRNTSRANHPLAVEKMAIDSHLHQPTAPPGALPGNPVTSTAPVTGTRSHTSNMAADPEKGVPVPLVNSGSNDDKKKVGGRICPVLPHLRGLDFNSDSDPEWASSDDILGKQIEAESGNALQYRTCSWQKVSFATALDPPSSELSLTASRQQPSSSPNTSA